MSESLFTSPTGRSASAPTSLADLRCRVRAGEFGADPTRLRVSVGFVTSQGARHVGRARGYRNELLSLRVGSAVGSCGVEPGALAAADDLLDECIGAPVDELLTHPVAAVRVAALDAYLMHARPHPHAGGVVAAPMRIPAGSSLAKSLARARVVIDLLPRRPGTTVLVIGVVNSLLAQLRKRGVHYIPCDLAGGRTEWGEAVCTDADAQLGRCDAVLATGMTLGNGTFDGLLGRTRARGLPLVMFAQTGSAVLPWFLDAGLSAVSAEPYPFFSLDGGPSTLFHYRGRAAA